MTDHPARPSYRALLAVPSLTRILVGMTISRIAGSMLAIALVLFTLERFQSPALAGLVTFAGIMPGLLISPIAGALLDRHGRTRLIVLDYLVAAGSLLLIGVLAIADILTPAMLVGIAVISSLTQPLSIAGLRSLMPLIVPAPLWERANAADSNGYVIATLIGPPLAALLVQVWGGPQAIIAIGLLNAAAAVVMTGIPDPPVDTTSSGRLLLDAWQGVKYTWQNLTLRWLGISVSIFNLCSGMLTIVLPILIVAQLGFDPVVVGLAWAISGVAGMASALFFGRLDSRGRERSMLGWPMLVWGLAAALLILAAMATQAVGLALIVLSMLAMGLVTGPFDIALFTVRQRRTDPAWMGRAFAVSMAINFSGYPIGAAIAGLLVGRSLELAIGFGVVAAVVAAVLAFGRIPQVTPEPETTTYRPPA